MPRTLSSSEYRKLQRLLVAARKAAGLTQMQVGERLGRPQSYVSKYENGERNLDVIDFVTVCQALGVSPAALVEQIGRELLPVLGGNRRASRLSG
ncbi:helix-turn-helix domain-containing protein [Variovorax sp. OV329]|uniref:helix-turn-helix domain-containing protein n=1 Tax=Variovorax sp. OV329 TaxID=1882825 RepID=UPI0008EF5CD2|nr:helix-turn-helix transcriptional regulator [Variovorax sp. OV329]SFN24134.1 Helix-turn-helix domain-containing protein [Variovorax sp. OV329]